MTTGNDFFDSHFQVHAGGMPTKEPTTYGPFGTRKVVRKGPKGYYTYHVVCATCDGGGTVGFPTKDGATSLAVRQSGHPCPCRPPCGAE
jgi:hypothetical protein